MPSAYMLRLLIMQLDVFPHLFSHLGRAEDGVQLCVCEQGQLSSGNNSRICGELTKGTTQNERIEVQDE